MKSQNCHPVNAVKVIKQFFPFNPLKVSEYKKKFNLYTYECDELTSITFVSFGNLVMNVVNVQGTGVTESTQLCMESGIRHRVPRSAYRVPIEACRLSRVVQRAALGHPRTACRSSLSACRYPPSALSAFWLPRAV